MAKNGGNPRHSRIPFAKRIKMRELFAKIADNKTGNRYIAMKLGLRSNAVTIYRRSHEYPIVNEKRLDIPFNELTPRAKRLVIKFGSKNFQI